MVNQKKDMRIQKAIKHSGSLHKMLKVKAWEKIPASKLRDKKTDTPLMRKRKNLAQTLISINKPKKKSLYI